LYFQQKTGANFEIVHYRGAAPATQDVIADHIDMNFDQAANSIPQYKAGKVKAFAVTAAKRLAAVPDVPTVNEVGLPGFYMSVWHGFWIPARHASRRRLEAQRGDGRSARGSCRSQSSRGTGPRHHAA
jgi:tripartite-type tricarboxylate transporter receptor subunit TctC